MTPECRHFPRCGGCQILDRDYPAQLLFKQDTLRRHFADWPDLDLSPVLPSPVTEGYRHKVQLPFGWEGARPTVGCYAAGSHEVVDQDECLVQDPELSRVVWAVREWAAELGVPIYREDTGSGWLRYLLLRKGLATGEILLGLVTTRPWPASGLPPEDLLERCRAALEAAVPGAVAGRVVGLVQNLNPGRHNVVLGGEERLIWGRPHLREVLGPFSFSVGLSTFFQVNPFQTPRLYDLAAQAVPAGAALLDLYCGIGTLTLWAARRSGPALGVEEHPASVEAARVAARENGMANAEFLAADASSAAVASSAAGGIAGRRFDVALVDPPRKGLEAPMREALKSLGLSRIIYVSCHPATLARDMRSLGDAFRAVSVAPVDMFPHTAHIECVAVLDAR